MLLGRGRVYLAVMVVSTLISSSSAHAHTMISVPEFDASKSNIVFQILDHSKEHSSVISGITTDGKRRICKSLSDSRCSTLDMIRVQIILPRCSSKSTTSDYCIRGLEMASADGKAIPATFLREVPTSKITANPSAKIGIGGGISIWRFPSGKFAESESEVASEVSLTYEVMKDKNTKKLKTVNLVNFEAAIHPVLYKKGNFEIGDYLLSNDGSDSLGVKPGSEILDDSSDCHWTEKGLCVLQGHFSEDSYVWISMQMDNRLNGWLSSQILDMKIQEKKISTVANLLIIGGKASISSPVYAIDNVSDISKVKELRAAYNRCGTDVLVCPQAFEQYDNLIWEGIFTDKIKDPEFNIGFADVISSGLTDIQGVDRQWKVRSMPQSNWRKGITWSPCVSNQNNLTGIVSTNASLYQMSPPEIQNQKLVSRVSGALKNEQLQLNRVDYQVSMRADALRCLLKSKINPKSVSASTFSKSGERLNYPGMAISQENEWLNFSVKQFSYSTPNIEFSFITGPDKVSTKTISCIKGKTIIKVKGTSPKCPKGYKKV